MKYTLILLLLPLFGMGQDTTSLYTANYTRGGLFVDTGQFRAKSRLTIMAGHEIAAYRYADSAWVFLDPGNAIRMLDNMAKEKMGWDSKPADTTRTYKAFCDCYEIRTKDFVWWEPSLRKDTIPATILVQYSYHDAITVRDVYLINGEPWYRSKAPLTRGKWIKPNWYRWKLSNGWSK